jgi:hypothetical protein
MRTIIYVIATFFVALLIGVGSAWYMIDQGSPLTTTRFGPWSSWLTEGNPNADPYTRAHLARSGRLPLTSSAARYFVARSDSAGRKLSASCEYSVTGPSLNARWWSIAVYDEQGSVVPNPSKRYSYNSDELLRHADGTYRIYLSKNARPENWLPSGDDTDRSLELMLRVYSPRETDKNGIGEVPPDRLPKIERLACE